jgi:hypothetical protein
MKIKRFNEDQDLDEFNDELDDMDNFEKLFNKHILGKKVIGEYVHESKENNDMFGLEVKGGYKYVIGYDFDPQTSYIISPKNKIIATYDNWNK